MVGGSQVPAETIVHDAASVRTLPDLARLLRHLRRREARRREGAALTYRELAAKTGWSHAIIGEYLTGSALPPTDRFDLLIQVLGAAPAELGPLATARDRVEEHRRPARAKPSTAVAVPRQLPAPVPGFVGRQRELVELERLVTTGAGGLVVAAVCGSGGVGKTALAIQWAHGCADRFRDGQLYVDLHGYAAADPLDPGDALARFLYALGVEPARIPTGTSERAAQFRTLLAGRRMLIVLDNAVSAEQVRPLLPGSPLCMVLVTSRDSLAGLVATEGAHRVDLDVLSDAEAVTLLRVLLGNRVDDAPEDAQALALRCGRLPLALRIAAELAASRADTSLAELVADLQDQQARLDLLDAGDERSAVRSVLSWSYRRLSPDAAALFRLLGCDPGPDIGVRAAASLGGIPLRSARTLLAELTRASILTETEHYRFTLHDVLRAYAAELARSADSEEVRRAALHRLLDHYLHAAVRADRLLDPTRLPIALDAAAEGVVSAPMDSMADAQEWFCAEHSALLAAVRLASDSGYADHAWQLPWAMATFLDRGGYWQEWAAINAIAIEAATGPAAAAQAHRGLARAAGRLGLVDTAADHYEQAFVHFGQAGDDLNQAAVQVNLSEMFLATGEIAEALAHQQHGLALFRSLGHEVGQAKSLNNIGYMHALLGDYEAALAECGESLALWQRLGDRTAAASVLDSLGYAHHRLGRNDEAIAYYDEALARHREAGHRLYQASVATHLGDAYRDAGRPADADGAWRAALAILDDLGHPDAADVRARLGGHPGPPDSAAAPSHPGRVSAVPGGRG